MIANTPRTPEDFGFVKVGRQDGVESWDHPCGALLTRKGASLRVSNFGRKGRVADTCLDAVNMSIDDLRQHIEWVEERIKELEETTSFDLNLGDEITLHEDPTTILTVTDVRKIGGMIQYVGSDGKRLFNSTDRVRTINGVPVTYLKGVKFREVSP